MSVKVLFLDIDGVLNTDSDRRKKPVCDFHSNIFSGKPLSPEGMNFNPESIIQLKRIVDNVPDLRLVISSNWRYHVKPKHFYELFAMYDIKPNNIDLIDQDEEDTFYKRSFLIAKYIKFKVPESKYIAVDDRQDLFHSEFSNVIFTKPEIGLTESKATIIIEFLNKDIKQPIRSLTSEKCEECGSLIYAASGGGVKCTGCSYWFCY